VVCELCKCHEAIRRDRGHYLCKRCNKNYPDNDVKNIKEKE